jgi:hypothetical protein
MTAELRRTNDWFEHDWYGKRRHKIESTKELFEQVLLPQSKHIHNVLEVGLCEAASSIWMLQNLKPQKWVGIDPWRPGRKHHVETSRIHEENFWHNMQVSGATCGHLLALGNTQMDFAFGETRCKVAKASSHDYLRSAIDLDFDDHTVDCYVVDGDHSSQGCLTDLVLGWRKLRPGGYIMLDDFDRRWHQGRAHVHEGVLAFWMAFEHLCEKVFESRKHVVFRRKLDG